MSHRVTLRQLIPFIRGFRFLHDVYLGEEKLYMVEFDVFLPKLEQFLKRNRIGLDSPFKISKFQLEVGSINKSEIHMFIRLNPPPGVRKTEGILITGQNSAEAFFSKFRG